MPTELPLNSAATSGPTPAADDSDAHDRELMVRITRQRDTAALEALYVRFRPRLKSFLRRLTHDEALIEEAYNDVMVTVWRKSHQYEARSKVSSWVFSIAYRACLRMVKKQQKRDATFEMSGDDLADYAAPEAPADTEGADALVAAVKQLKPNHRLVIELCYFEGHQLGDIAQIVGCPTNTVKTRLHHARKNLRKIMETAQERLDTNNALANESSLS